MSAPTDNNSDAKTNTKSNWIEDAKSLLKLFMNHTNAQPLIDSFYANYQEQDIKKKLHFKQIETNLNNLYYDSMHSLFIDIAELFENAIKIFQNHQNISQLNEIFIKYKQSYLINNNNVNTDKPTTCTKRRRSARIAALKINNNIVINVKNDKKNLKRKKRDFEQETQINKIARLSINQSSPQSLNIKPTRRRSKKKTNTNTPTPTPPIIDDDNDDDDDDDIDLDVENTPTIRYKLRSQTRKSMIKLSESGPDDGGSKYKCKYKPGDKTRPHLNGNSSDYNINDDDDGPLELDFSDGLRKSLCGAFDSDTGMKYSCCSLCIRGGYKEFNQDCISLNIFSQFKHLSSLLFCGVYDGHGILGHNTSKYVARHLPRSFIFELYELYNNNNNNNDIIELALINALNVIDFELREISCSESVMFCKILRRVGCTSRSGIIDYGTTVNCLVSDGYNIYNMNIGDSRCILCEIYDDNNIKLSQISSDHSPANRNDEIERVRQSGGTFSSINNDLRLYPANKSFGEARKSGLAINMTRAVGHDVLSKYGLISVPEIYKIKINKNIKQYIFILGSDGIWDVLNNKEIFENVKLIYNNYSSNNNNNNNNNNIENQIAHNILQNAEKKWKKKGCGDNISVCVTSIIKQ